MVRKPLLLPSSGEMFEEVVTGLGIVVVAGVDVVLYMGVNVLKVVVVDTEDVFVVEVMVDVNVTVVADMDGDYVEALVMCGVVPWWCRCWLLR